MTIRERLRFMERRLRYVEKRITVEEEAEHPPGSLMWWKAERSSVAWALELLGQLPGSAPPPIAVRAAVIAENNLEPHELVTFGLHLVACGLRARGDL